MGSLNSYIFLMGGLLILANIFGLIDNTANSVLLDAVLNPQDLQNSELYTKIVIIVEVAIATAAIGLAFVQKTDFPLVALLVIPVLNFGWDFISLFQLVYAEIPAVAVALIGPMFLVYIFAVVNWWRGIAA